MSYQSALPLLPRLTPRSRGFGAIQSSLYAKDPHAYYIALIEVIDSKGRRTYSWTAPRWLSFWEVNAWEANMPILNAAGNSQGYIMYSWNGRNWAKTGDDTTRYF